MTIHREERITYRAECDVCGARGPARDNPRDAIEAVTAEATTNRTGISLLGRWYQHHGDTRDDIGLRCPACYATLLGRKEPHP